MVTGNAPGKAEGLQRAIAQQEFPAVVPADLVGRTVALRRALDESTDDLSLAAAARTALARPAFSRA